MGKIKFSVVMGVYYKDKPEFVKRAIESLLEQTYLPSEIILIEDGKLTAELYETINKMKKNELLKVFSLPENQGVATAINFGVKKAQYDYIARMDADDVCMKDRFEKQFKYLEKYPKVDIIGGQICEYDSKLENKIAIRKVPNEDKEIKKRCKFKSPINNTTVIFKKSIFEILNGYDESYKVMEDYEFYIRAVEQGFYFHNLEDILVNVRTDREMYLRRGGREYIKYIIKIEKTLLEKKLINKFIYFYNVIIRSIVCFLPNFFRKNFYTLFLRKNIGNFIDTK